LSSCFGTKEAYDDYDPVQELYDKELPHWARNANIYEVNIRQYTEEGTFKAFEKHLTRLSTMGVDIIWLMPIYPISETKRKGKLGSYYAVSDYQQINPEFGTMEDFDALVDRIHTLGMYVILDWVPNHTGWDHEWLEEHPEWYTTNDLGEIIDPTDPNTGESWGWTDVADLNYDNKELWEAMIKAKLFWLKKHKVDGFRDDVAKEVPDEFWDEAMKDLYYTGKPVFMLAEAEHPPHRNSENFHMSYGWSFHHLLNEIAQNKKTALDLKKWHEEDKRKFQKGFQMNFITNHDENSWNGTVFERMSEKEQRALFTLCATFEGMALVYGGQEEPLKHRLRFFEKDTIGFENYQHRQYYHKLFSLKHNNQALWNGSYGGPAEIFICDEKIFAFKREMNGHTFYGIFNLSDEPVSFNNSFTIKGLDVIRKSKANWGANTRLSLEPWDFYLISEVPSKK